MQPPVSSLAPDSVIEVGLLVETRGDLHSLQRLDVNRGFNLSRVCTDSAEGLPSLPATTSVISKGGLEDLLKAESIELIWLPGGKESQHVYRQIEESLNAGKHVVVGSATALTPAEWSQLEATAERQTKGIIFNFPAEFEPGFLLALQVVHAGELGSLRKILNLEYAYAGTVAIPSDIPLRTVTEPLSEQGLFVTRGMEALHQMVLLHNSPAKRIFARQVDLMELAFQIEFADGLIADWEVAFTRSAPLGTGWYLQGTLGGFAEGHHYRVEPDGEQVKNRLEPVVMLPDPFLGAIMEQLRSGSSMQISSGQFSLLGYRRCFELAAAARRSLAGGNWEAVTQNSAER